MATRKLLQLYSRGLIRPESIDVETREVDVVFATENPVERFEWNEHFLEILVCDDTNIRRERIERGLPVLDCHSTQTVKNQIGRTVKIWINDNRELCARIRFSSRPDVRDIFKDIEEGIIKDISVGYKVYKYEKDSPKEGVPVYRAVDWMPTELSLQPVQADILSEVRSDSEPTDVEIISKTNTERMKRTAEEGKKIDYTVEGQEVKAGDIVTVGDMKGVALADGEDGAVIELVLIGDETETPLSDEQKEEAEQAAREALKENQEEEDEDDKNGDGERRFNTILQTTRSANLPDTYAVEFFRNNVTPEQCRKSVIKILVRSQKPIDGNHTAKVGTEGIDKKQQAMQNAILHRADPSRFKLDQGNYFRGYTLAEMTRDILSEKQVNVQGMDKMSLADHVFKRTHSSTDFPLLFEGVIDKMLRPDYDPAEEFWPLISRETSNADFRAKNFYQVDSENGMQEVEEGGEIRYTTLKESKQYIRLKSYAEGIIFTRKAFINDDLNAFSIIPGKFRMDWNEIRGELVWGLITQNVKIADGHPIFSNDHGNYISGADSALGEVSLSKAVALMKRQTGLNGKRKIRVIPKFLIVPPELERTALKLVTDTTPANTEDVNVHAKKFQVIVESRLDEPKEWYLSADPNSIDSLYHSYLEGQKDLRVNTEEDFNRDAMKFGVRGDFGTAAVDHRGLFKSKGKA